MFPLTTGSSFAARSSALASSTDLPVTDGTEMESPLRTLSSALVNELTGVFASVALIICFQIGPGRQPPQTSP